MLSDYLKQNSKEQHASLEEKYKSNHIFDKTYRLQDYKNFIYANYALHHSFEVPLEQALSEEFKSSIQYKERKKLVTIENEISALGLPLLGNSELYRLESEAQAIGILYVMEGSTLGGNIIKKQLSKNEEFANMEFNFLGIYGAEVGNYWKKFISQINDKFQEESYPNVLTGTMIAYTFLQNFKGY